MTLLEELVELLELPEELLALLFMTTSPAELFEELSDEFDDDEDESRLIMKLLRSVELHTLTRGLAKTSSCLLRRAPFSS